MSIPQPPAPWRRLGPATPPAAALLVAAITACGGGGKPSTTPPGTGAKASPTSLAQVIAPARTFGDACRLLSPAETRAALGRGPVLATSEVNPQLGSYCRYTTADARADLLLTIQVIVHGSAGEARTGVEQVGGSPLSGIGDAARSSTLVGQGRAVDLARGPIQAVVSTFANVPQAALVHLAAVVAQRL